MLTAAVLIFCTALLFSFARKEKRVLVFSLTKGYHHHSIAAGITAIQQLGEKNGFAVDTTTDASLFTTKNLKKYRVIIFLSTTGTVFNEVQQEAFKTYIHQGGGYVGIHAATDTEYDWPWYNQLVGAYFKSHPKPQKADVLVQDRTFIATKMLPEKWNRYDEWYNFKMLDTSTKVLVSIDEKSYEGGKNGDKHPMSWYHEFEGRPFDNPARLKK